MSEAVVLLGLVWAVVLLPGLIRDRRTSLHSTVGGFERAMDVLRPPTSPAGHGAGDRALMVPAEADRIVARETAAVPRAPRTGREDPLIVRRRAAFTRLLVATGITVVAAVFLGGVLWPLLLVMGVVTATYAALLRHFKLQRDEARRVVRDLEPERSRRPRGFDAVPAARAVGDDWRADPPAGPAMSPPASEAGSHEDPWSSRSGVRIRRWEQ